MICPNCREEIRDTSRSTNAVIVILLPLLIGVLFGYFILPLIVTTMPPITADRLLSVPVTTVVPALKEPDPVSTQPKEWVQVTQMSGNGTKTSDKFKISGEKWAIMYKTGNVDFAGLFQIFVYDKSGNLISVAANTDRETEEQTYIHDSGEFYIEVNSFGLDWALIIMEYK
jgi:hypothetical protein